MEQRFLRPPPGDNRCKRARCFHYHQKIEETLILSPTRTSKIFSTVARQLFLLISVPAQILAHPANKHKRVRALARSIAWQSYRRIMRKPLGLRVYGGLRIRLYPGDGSSGSNICYFGQFHEYDEMHFLKRYLRPGDGFLDGGANIGVYSLLAHSVIGDSGRIDAFEPAPDMARRAKENFELNRLNNIHLHDVAIAETGRMTNFRVDLGVGNRELAPSENGRTVMVRCVALDEYPPGSPVYALAKLDLEGNELVALRGSQARLARRDPPVWLIEATDSQLARYGNKREEVFDLLEQSGYDLARYDGCLNQLFLGRQEAQHAKNFLAIASDHRIPVLERIAQATNRKEP
jgi:FkbM family methyltransferase